MLELNTQSLYLRLMDYVVIRVDMVYGMILFLGLEETGLV
jgi:hypothetical protein